MEEVGRVLEASNGLAKVKMNRTEACAACGKCGMAALAPASDIVVDAINEVGAEPGDWVRIEMESSQFLKATFVIFIFPLFAAVIGYGLASLLSGEMGIAPAKLGFFGAILFFLLSYAGIRAYDRRARESGRFRPSIVEVFTDR